MEVVLGQDVELLHASSAWRIARWRNVLIIVVADVPVAENIAAIRRAQARMRELEGAVGAVTLVTELRVGRLDLSEEMRSEIREIARGVGLRGYAAVVIEPQSLLGAAIRALLTGIFLVAQPDVPHRIFDNRRSAAEHLMHKVTLGWSAEELALVMDRVARGL